MGRRRRGGGSVAGGRADTGCRPAPQLADRRWRCGGGSRRHLLALLLTESCLLALLGGVAALGVAYGTVRFIGALIPTEAAGIVSLTLDPIVVPFVSTLSVGAGLLLGILPALHASRAVLYEVEGLPTAVIVAAVAGLAAVASRRSSRHTRLVGCGGGRRLE